MDKIRKIRDVSIAFGDIFPLYSSADSKRSN